jgi:nitrite reductase/ring-hydroxylating ferredoxin subunit
VSGVKADRRVRIGTLADLASKGRLVETVDGREIVVLEYAGKLRAYENNCPHQGGPVGEGKLVSRVESVVNEDDGSVSEDRFVPSDVRLVCPWHGYEFDFDSGVCAADARIRLRARTVVVDGEEIYVTG